MNVLDQLKKHPQDTGSSAVQVVLLTQQIAHLTKHIGENKKDFACRRTLLKNVATRKRLMAYLKRKDDATYRKVLDLLSLKK